jgi:lysophospholipase L1-like esterase
MLRNLTLLGVSLAITCALLELVLRLFYPVPATWIDPQVHHLKSPLVGWVLPPGAEAWTIDAPVHVNSLGLRDEELTVEKPPGTKRVLCLGDSFTFALGVRLEDLYAKQLERKLTSDAPSERFQVINAGIAGYNTRQELITYLTLGKQLDPDLVVLGFYWNDLVGNAEPIPDLENTPRIPAAEPDAFTPRGQHRIPAPIRNLLRQSVLLYLTTTGAQAIAAQLSPPTDLYSVVQRALLTGDAATLTPYWRETAMRLTELAAAAKARGVPVILLAFPSENEVRHEFPKLIFAEKLREIWAPTGFPMVDLTSAYRDSRRAGENPFLPYDLHPNAVGMRIAAGAVYDVIRERGYLGLADAPPPIRNASGR